MVVETPLMTVEAFWEQYAGKPVELIHGKVVEVSPSGTRASAIAARILIKLGIFLEANPLGVVTGADGGYVLDGHTLRAPDVGFFGRDKADRLLQPEKYAPFEPDLAVEVVSPGDDANQVQEKVALYLDTGVKLVWVVFPDLQQIVVHHPDRTSRTFTAADTLDGGDVLPGFTLPVADVFAV